MKEKDTNTLLVRELRKKGFSHKIADPVGGMGIQNPFDGFGVINNKPLYWEGKIIKGGFYSFNFNRIEDHQMKNLIDIKNDLPDSLCLVIVGLWKSRNFLYYMLFDIKLIEFLRGENKNSLKGKELQKFFDEGFYLEVKKKTIINLDDFENKIVTVETYKDILL